MFVGKIKIAFNSESSNVDHSDTVIKGGRTSEGLPSQGRVCLDQVPRAHPPEL